MPKRKALERDILPVDVIREFNDRSTKWLLADTDRFAAFMALAAANIAGALDYSRMTLLPESLIPSSFRRRDADLIVLVPFKVSEPGEQQVALVYVKVAHQTKPDPTVIFRLLRDMIVLWERQIRQEQKKTSPPQRRQQIRNLRVIIPVVFYTGPVAWEIPLSLADCMDIPAGLEGFVPRFDILTLNLREKSDSELTASGDPFGQLMLLMKRAYSNKEEFSNALAMVLPKFQELGEAEFEWAMTYLMGLIAHKRPASEQKDLIAQVEEGTPEHIEEIRDMTVTLAQEWKKQRQEGRKEGRKEGRTEGEKVGRTAGARELAQRQLQKRFGALPASVEQKLQQLGFPELEALLDRSSSARSLEEMGL